MRRDAHLLLLVFSVLAATAFFGASDASATVLCKTATNPCSGGIYPVGSMIEASTKGHSILHNAFTTVECGSTFKGKVTGAGGEATVVSGTVTALALSGCTGFNTVTVLKNGTFSISYTSGGNGTLKLEGFEIEVLNHNFGGTCIYTGTASLTLKGGTPASIATSGTTLARTAGTLGAFCGSTGAWTAEYKVTAPEPLYVEKEAVPPQTVLCKTATDPCTGGTYGTGTAIQASLKMGTQSVLKTNFGQVKCGSSTIKGEVGSSGEAVIVTSVIFGECNCGVNALKNGTLAIKTSGGNNGTLTSSGMETKTLCLEIDCIFTTNSTSLGSVQGGSIASLAISATVPRTGGESGAEICGSTGTWTAEYTVTTPEPLYVEKKAVPSTVLCKTATNPCSGGTYTNEAMIEASTKGHSILHNAFTTVECGSTFQGEVVTAAGEGGAVWGTVTALALSGCTGFNTVTVLKNGTFSISYTSGGNGTLKLEGFEIEVLNHNFGGTCIYTGTASLTLKGGTPASIATSGTTLARTAGTLGAFCGSTGAWTAEYKVTAPEPLYVETI